MYFTFYFIFVVVIIVLVVATDGHHHRTNYDFCRSRPLGFITFPKGSWLLRLPFVKLSIPQWQITSCDFGYSSIKAWQEPLSYRQCFCEFLTPYETELAAFSVPCWKLALASRLKRVRLFSLQPFASEAFAVGVDAAQAKSRWELSVFLFSSIKCAFKDLQHPRMLT